MQRIRTHGRTSARGGLRTIAVAALLACAAATLHAQSWERTYGNSRNQNGTAVVQLSDGGYAVGGVDYSLNGDDLYVYVLRTDNSGLRIWDRQFYIGPENHGQATDVKECSNGDILVIGYIGPTVYNCNGCWHIFAMRLDVNGKLIWERTYGNISNDQFPQSVVETQFGNGGATNAGDFVIGGYSVDPNFEYRGMLMRITSQGNPIWAQHYDLSPNRNGSVTLISCVDESRVGAGAGDIIVGGYGDVTPNSFDMWMARVDGASGTIGASPQGSATYGLGAHDWGMSIQELRNGGRAGDIVMVGGSYSLPGVGAPSVALLVETGPDPCGGIVADHYLGNIVRFDISLAYSVREITDGANGTPGDVMIAGITQRTGSSLLSQAFLQEFQQGTLAKIGSCHTFGGNNNEGAYSLTEALTSRGPGGFVFTGNVSSVPIVPGNSAYDIYLVKADVTAAQWSCNDSPITEFDAAAGLHPACPQPTLSDPNLPIMCGIGLLPVDWTHDMCVDWGVPARPNVGGGREMILTDEVVSMLRSFPNPVTHGEDITITFKAAEAGIATITVSDITGRIIYTATTQHSAGTAHAPLATKGWAPGAYTVKVATGGRAASGRIVVAGR